MQQMQQQPHLQQQQLMRPGQQGPSGLNQGNLNNPNKQPYLNKNNYQQQPMSQSQQQVGVFFLFSLFFFS
jgi:hypothetical protein